jgi:hypothetical protein
MLSALRKRLSYANVTATLAVFFAMSGGAYAASHYLITSPKQIKPSVLASLKGKAGPAGATGSNGAVGPAGPAGATGPAGPQGPQGASGANGEPGKEGKQGKEGREGKEGKEGTFGGQSLPAGKTLTGAYAATGFGEAAFPEPGSGFVEGAASFALPVPNVGNTSELEVSYIQAGVENATGTGDITEGSTEVTNVHTTSGEFTVGAYIQGTGSASQDVRITAVGSGTLTLEAPAGETKTAASLTAGFPAGCTGNASEPGAEEGHLCVFGEGEANLLNPPSVTLEGSAITAIGFTIHGGSATKGYMSIQGTWAVTAK